MNIRSLAEISACLESIASDTPGVNADPLSHFLQIESLAIEILDSEWSDFPENVLEEFLKNYLSQKRMELGVSESDLQ